MLIMYDSEAYKQLVGSSRILLSGPNQQIPSSGGVVIAISRINKEFHVPRIERVFKQDPLLCVLTIIRQEAGRKNTLVLLMIARRGVPVVHCEILDPLFAGCVVASLLKDHSYDFLSRFKFD